MKFRYLLILPFLVAPLQATPVTDLSLALNDANQNITIRNDRVGGIFFTTIDIRVTEEWLKKDYEIIDFDTYTNIRTQGCVIDMFYSNAGMGKSQWAEMDTRGIYIHSPGSIYMEPAKYAKNGVEPGWLLRISLMYPAANDPADN